MLICKRRLWHCGHPCQHCGVWHPFWAMHTQLYHIPPAHTVHTLLPPQLPPSPSQFVSLLPVQGLHILSEMMDVSIVIGVSIPCKHLKALCKNSSPPHRQAVWCAEIGNSLTCLEGCFNVPHHHSILSQAQMTFSLLEQPGGPHFPKVLERLSDTGPRLHRKSGGSAGNRRGPSWVPLQCLDHKTILPLPRLHIRSVVEPGIAPKFPDTQTVLHCVQSKHKYKFKSIYKAVSCN